MENLTSWQQMAKELVMTVDELTEFAKQNGLIDENGNPTQFAIDNGFLVPVDETTLN